MADKKKCLDCNGTGKARNFGPNQKCTLCNGTGLDCVAHHWEILWPNLYGDYPWRNTEKAKAPEHDV